MKGSHRPALQKTARLLALWLILLILLTAGKLPSAQARPSEAPAAFNKSSPTPGVTGQPLAVTLQWTASSDAISYEYCYDTTPNGNCSTWTDVGNVTSITTPQLSEYTSYNWHVRALNGTGTTYSDGAPDAFWAFTTGGKPLSFTKSTPGNNVTGQPLNLNLTWTASGNVSWYEYCMDTSNDSACDPSPGWINISSVTSKSVGPLSPATIYYWHVRAHNDFGITYSGAGTTAFRPFTTLGPPGAFSKTAPAIGATGQPFSLSLTWGASTEAASYEYCYDIIDDGDCTNWIGAGTALTASLTNLSPGTTYYWQVRAINSVDTTYANGSSAAYWSFTTGSAPGVFGKTSPIDGATSQPLSTSLSWGPSAGAVSYEYCIDTSDNNTCNTQWVNTGALRTASPALNAATDYYWHVRAINTFGTTDSDGGAFWHFSTGTPPGAFNKTSPSIGAGNQLPTLDLVWGASTGAASYEYCYDTSNDGTCTWISAQANTSVTLSGLTAGATYYWHVRALNPYGTTYSGPTPGPAAFRSFTIGAAPGPFSKSNPSSNASGQSVNPVLQWSSSTNVGGYEYCYDTLNNNQCDGGWSDAGLLTSVQIGPLLENTTYYWHVRAYNAYGITYSGGSETLFRAFTTGFLPGAFGKTSPTNNALNQPVNPTLTWGTSSGTGVNYAYCLETSTALCDPGSLNWISTGTQTSVPVSSLSPSTKYFWHVRATNTVGTTYSGASSSAFFNFTTGTPPAAFGKNAPADNALNVVLSPTLSWGTSTGAVNYAYCYDTTNDSACDNNNWVTLSATSVQIGPLDPGIPYYWQVRAQNSFGWTYADGDVSAWWSFTTVPLPAAFDKTGPSDGALNQSLNPTLQWQASTGAVRYRYCIDTNDNNACDATWVDIGNTTSLTIGPLSSDTTYYWHVRAHNSSGFTLSGPLPAAFWSFTTGPAPGPFARTGPANNATGVALNPALSWGASTGVDNYEYCYSTDQAVTLATCSPWTSTAKNTTVSLASLSEYTTYYWHVRAANTYGRTYSNGSSAFWSFTTGGKPLAFGKSSPANTLTTAQPLTTNLSWNPSGSADDYQYCLATSAAACTNWTSTAGAVSVPATGLAPSTVYHWHVRAINDFGTTYSNGTASTWSFITAGVCPAISGWKGEYWRNEGLAGPAVICRDDGPVVFLERDFQYGSPDPKIPADHFGARWTRTVNFPTAGQYIFRVDHDDGARLYVDNSLKGNWWSTCCQVDRTAAIYLSAGSHTLRLEMHETNGAAYAHVWWDQVNAQFISLSSQDGWILESSEISTQGGSLNASASTFLLGDDAADRQYRSILSFNTAGLPDNAVVSSVMLKIKGGGVVGTNPFSTHGKILGDVRTGPFSGSASLQAGDFQAASSQDAVFSFSNNPASGWYSAKSTSAGLGRINLKGVTQIRLRFQLGDNDDAGSDYMKFYSGNYATAASRPLLIVWYYIP